MTRPRMTIVSSGAAVDDRPPGRVMRDHHDVVLHVVGDLDDLPRLASVIEAVDRSTGFRQRVAAPDRAGDADVLGDVAVTAIGRPVLAPGDFHELVTREPYAAVVVHADGHIELCAVLAANRLGVPVVRIGGVPDDPVGRVSARLADLLLTRSPSDQVDAPEVLAPERAKVVGNPLEDAVRRHARAALAAEAWRRHGLEPESYVLAILAATPDAPATIDRLAALAARTPLVVVGSAVASVPGARVARAAGFHERLSLIRGAQAIVTDSSAAREQTAALGAACHSLQFRAEDVLASGSVATTPAIGLRDGQAGERAASALVASFARVQLG